MGLAHLAATGTKFERQHLLAFKILADLKFNEVQGAALNYLPYHLENIKIKIIWRVMKKYY